MSTKTNQSKDSYIGSISLSEEIRAKDAYDYYNSLKTIIDGKRDVGFLELTKEMEPKIIKHNLGVIPVRMTSQRTMMAIIYRDKSKALRLYEFTKKYNGFLTDRDPIEAREIGRLLGYIESDIEEYVNKKYGGQNLQEETTPQLNKKVVEIVKDEEGNEVRICTVSGAFVKGKNPGLDFIQFVEGGHHYVDSYPGYKKHIPEDEIWVDEVFQKTPENFLGIVGHEFKERNNMKYHKMSYDKAHDLSNKAEKIFRDKKDKLNENYQFSKIKNLMKKIIT
jgi:hypothetical protein